MKDEQLQILMNTFSGKRGLQFWCKASPISKQSKNKIKKDVNLKLQERISKDKFISEKLKDFFNSEVGIQLTFGLSKSRYKKNDVGNLIKNSLDCLKKILFKDDSQVKEISASKHFVNEGVSESTGIRIYKIK